MLYTKVARSIIILVALLGVLFLPTAVAYADEDSAEVTGSVTAALTISDVSVSNIGYHSATISWETNGKATSQVFYDTVWHDNTADYTYHTDEDTSLVFEHSVALTGLSSSTTYHYRVKSAIDTEFTAISEDYTFKTLTPAAPAVGNGVAPTYYYTETNLFGGVADFRISRTGEILSRIEATSEDGNLTVIIPKGTIVLGKDGKRLRSLQTAVDESPPSPPEDAHIIGLAYDFGPDGATFDPPLTLEYTYEAAEIPEGVAEEDLVLAYYDEVGGEWVELPSTVDVVTHTITASVSHFTTFAIIAPPAPAPPEEEVAPPEEEEVAPPEEEKPAPPEEEVAPPEEEVAPPEEEVPEVPPPAPINWPVIGGIIAAVVAGLLIYFLVFRRRGI